MIMEVFEKMNGTIPFVQMIEFSIRILVAGVCGAMLGYERSRRFKEAGIRTHVLVACASALLMIVSKYGFADLTGADGTLLYGTRGADSARIAAQVVSGVGFLGAGVIFKHGTAIKGLTTAAGIWATAGIGLAVGSGMYYLGIFLTVSIVLFQLLMHKQTLGTDFVVNEIHIEAEESLEFQNLLRRQFRDWKVQIEESDIKKRNGMIEYHLMVKMPRQIEFDEILEFMEKNEAVKTFESHAA